MTTNPVLCFRAILLSIIIFYMDSGIASELPVEAFSGLPNIESPKLSPDGSKVAYIQNVENPDLTLLMYVT
jgi:hypothetical protein